MEEEEEEEELTLKKCRLWPCAAEKSPTACTALRDKQSLAPATASSTPSLTSLSGTSKSVADKPGRSIINDNSLLPLLPLLPLLAVLHWHSGRGKRCSHSATTGGLSKSRSTPWRSWERKAWCWSLGAEASSRKEEEEEEEEEEESVWRRRQKSRRSTFSLTRARLERRPW
eukprot:scaffold1058_cov155-Ochromonas_danica.AAC.13